MAQPKNLFEYYRAKNQALPSVAERASLAPRYGIQNYTGTVAQNAKLLTALQAADSTWQAPLIAPTTPINKIITPSGVTIGGTPDVTTLPKGYQNGVPAYTPTEQAPITPDTVGFAPAPRDAPAVPVSPKDEINASIASITAQKQSIEDELNGIGDARNTELTDAGVYDKLKQLGSLDERLTNIQSRSDLRKTGPTTKDDYASYSTARLEKNAAASITLSNQINTQLAITNQKFDEKRKADEFKLDQTDKYLGTLQTAYGDIITGEQSAALEDRKQQNAIDLKNLDFNNGMIKDAYTAAIQRGANPAEVQNALDKGDLSGLYSLKGNIPPTKEDTAKHDAEIAAARDVVKNVQGMLDNSRGLRSSVGPGWLGSTSFGSIKDIITDYSNERFGEANAFRTDAKALVSAETLTYFQKVKAEGANFGAMSDAEWDILASASNAKYLGIDRDTGKSNLPEEEFKKKLGEYQRAAKKAVIADAFTKAGKDPKTVKNLSPEAIDSLYQQVNTPPTQDYNSELSLNKGTSNNVPQRNNNPGNVKGGGLATVQALSTGKDKQGHLIFPTPEAGYQALALDLTAKLSGNSRYLPANPTIAQLGKVYAEDGNWGRSVARILGVPENTPTTSVPFEDLIYAISKQEGFFA